MWPANSKKKVISDRGTSSSKWRNLVFKKLNEFEELKTIFRDEGIIYIYQLLALHDTDFNRKGLIDSVISCDIKLLQKMQGRFPYDFDEEDYPVLTLIFMKTNLDRYTVVMAEDGTYSKRVIIKIVTNSFIDKNVFKARMLIYPL